MLISSSSSASDNICLNFSLAVLLDNGDCSSKSSSRNKLIASVLDPVLSSSSDSLVVLSLLLSEPLLLESSSSDLLLSETSLSESLSSESSLSELSGFWNSGSGSSTRLRFDEVDCVVTLVVFPYQVGQYVLAVFLGQLISHYILGNHILLFLFYVQIMTLLFTIILV